MVVASAARRASSVILLLSVAFASASRGSSKPSAATTPSSSSSSAPCGAVPPSSLALYQEVALAWRRDGKPHAASAGTSLAASADALKRSVYETKTPAGPPATAVCEAYRRQAPTLLLHMAIGVACMM